jgi:hypothetical protein
MIRNLLLAAALAAAFPAAAQDAPKSPVDPAPKKMVDCLQTRSIQQAQAANDRHWYVRMRDGKWYRNTMDCPGLALRRALVHVSPIGSQCRGDIVQVVDFTLGGVSFGGCGLGSWEPVDGPPGKKGKQ